METKLKQRLVGIIVLVVLMLIVVPLLFTGSKKKTMNGELSTAIPTPSPTPIIKPVVPQAAMNTNSVVQSKVAIPVAVKTVTTEAGPALVAPKVEMHKKMVVVKKPVAMQHHKKVVAPKHHAMVKKSVYKQQKWTVQLGSFSSEPHAVNMVKKLRAKNIHAYTRPAKVGEKIIYRVYVGPEANKAMAAHLKQRMHREFKLQGLVVKYN